MIKNILVPVAGFSTDAAALETAFLIGRLFDAYLTCAHFRPDAAQLATRATAEDLGAGMVAAELFEALKEQGEIRSKNARATFDAFSAGLGLGAPSQAARAHRVSAEFREIIGDSIDDTIAEGRFHDLVVLARSDEVGDFSPGAIGRILIACGRPLLIAPPEPPENLAPTVAIAWKETAEAARAVTAVMPLLVKADRNYVLAADETDTLTAIDSAEHLANQLRRHGMSAEARCVVPGKRAVPDAIIDAAREAGADLLVMGGYGHSRVRESVFGGFTRHALEACPLPVFLSH